MGRVGFDEHRRVGLVQSAQVEEVLPFLEGKVEAEYQHRT